MKVRQSLVLPSHPQRRLTYAERNESCWRRNLVVCVFGSFTTLVSLTMLLPFLPLYIQQLGVPSQSETIMWSGVAFSATFMGTALTAPLWGRLADRYGRKPMLIRAAVGMAVIMSLIGLVDNVYQLVILRLIAGLLGGYASASTVMIGTQAPSDQAGWALGMLSTGSLAGSLIGPLIGGFMPNLIGIRGTFFAGGAMISLTALLTIFVVKENFQRTRDSVERSASKAPIDDLPNNYLVVTTLMCTAMMVLFANMSIEPIISIYIEGLSVDQERLVQITGLVMACSAFGSMLTAAKLGALADRIGGWRVITGCLLLAGIVIIPQAFATSWWQLAGLRVLMGMCLAGLLPAIAKLVRHAVQEGRRGQILGYLQSAQSAGQVLGPLVGGQIAIATGPKSVFFVTGALMILCACIALWVQTKCVEKPNNIL